MKNLIDSLINISKRDYKFHWWNSSREIIMYYVLSQPVKEFHQKGMYSEEEVKELLYKFELIQTESTNIVEFVSKHACLPINYMDWFNHNKKK